jgi:Protein of unknown function (DUF3426).
MKTSCPNCQTTFSLRPDQIRLRAGTVRCGHCRFVFDALDNLLDESLDSLLVSFPADEDHESRILLPELESEEVANLFIFEDTKSESPILFTPKQKATILVPVPATDELPHPVKLPINVPEIVEIGEISEPVSPHRTEEIGEISKPVSRRKKEKMPSNDHWDEDVPDGSLLPEKSAHWPFFLLTVLLLLLLVGQAVFHHRGELAVLFPAQRSLFETASQLFGRSLPLPAHAELVSIETSDLQTDTANNLLILNATLRNRAPYGQRYPSLELSLTDTQNITVVRRVFSPKEYLPPKLSANPFFPANADIAVRLWIDAKQVSAAGYRLEIFYL